MINAGIMFNTRLRHTPDIRKMPVKTGSHQVTKTRVLQLLDLQDHDHFLEVGSVHGKTLKEASEQFDYGRLVGFRVSDAILSEHYAGIRDPIHSGRLEIRFGDGRELPFEWESFNKVLTVITRDLADAEEILEEIYRVLKPGGLLVLGTCTTAVEGKEMLKNSGFVPINAGRYCEDERLTCWTVAQKPKVRSGRI